MRRWFKLAETENGSFYDPPRRQFNEASVFISMPYVDDLVEILNRSAGVFVDCYSGSGTPQLCGGNPDKCLGQPVDMCIGTPGDPTPHTYVPQTGSYLHDFRPESDQSHQRIAVGDVHYIATFTLIACLIAGFPDVNGDRAPPVFSESFDGPPSKNG